MGSCAVVGVNTANWLPGQWRQLLPFKNQHVRGIHSFFDNANAGIRLSGCHKEDQHLHCSVKKTLFVSDIHIVISLRKLTIGLVWPTVPLRVERNTAF